DTGTMELVWFQSIGWLRKSLKIGAAYVIYGKPNVFNQELSMTHPEMELYQRGAKEMGNMHLQPVYSSTEKLKKFALDSRGIQRLQVALLESISSQLEEELPDYIIEMHRLIPLPRALIAIHF